MTAGDGFRHAAEMAAKTLVACGVQRLPASALSMLNACRNTRVYTLEGALEAEGIAPAAIERLFRLADAVTYRRGEGDTAQYIVVFRADGNPARLRFTLAHELGHRILHQGRSAGAREEEEADCFASHLLCPQAVVLRIRQDSPDFETAVDRIAQVCYVTRACARSALKRPRVGLLQPLAQAMERLAETEAEAGFPKGE